MKAVILKLSDAEFDRRRRLGLDRWDEMWEGVLHVPPAPFSERPRLVLEDLDDPEVRTEI